MSKKRFTYTTRLITDKKGYYKYYILDNETLLNTEQIVAILNAQDEYIDYVTKERNLAYIKLNDCKEKVLELEKEIQNLKNKKIRKLEKQNEILRKEYLKIPKGIRDVWE